MGRTQTQANELTRKQDDHCAIPEKWADSNPGIENQCGIVTTVEEIKLNAKVGLEDLVVGGDCQSENPDCSNAEERKETNHQNPEWVGEIESQETD